MAICPKCNKKINSLKEFDKSWAEYEFTVDKDDTYHQIATGEVLPADDDIEFECPLCKAVLFDSDNSVEEATKFLQGK